MFNKSIKEFLDWWRTEKEYINLPPFQWIFNHAIGSDLPFPENAKLIELWNNFLLRDVHKELHTCCFCGTECNPHSQSCGSCARSETLNLLEN